MAHSKKKEEPVSEIESDEDVIEEIEEIATAGEGIPETDVDDDDDDDNIEVPDELCFDTDNGAGDDTIDRIPIKIDGLTFYLYRPSDALIYLLGGSLAQGSDVAERFNAMMQLIQVSLDETGNMYLRQRMFDRRNNFNDEFLGQIAAVILKRWGGKTNPNRAARRQAARAKTA